MRQMQVVVDYCRIGIQRGNVYLSAIKIIAVY